MSNPIRRVAYVAVMTMATPVAAQPGPQAVAIAHVTVIPMTKVPYLRDQTVLLRGDRIAALGPASTVVVPRGARRIDGRGRFLIPGLWDMHAHVRADDVTRGLVFPLYVANGVTGLRVMAGDCDSLCAGEDSAGYEPRYSVVARWKREITDGTLIAPRIVAAGMGLEGPQRVFPPSRIVRDSADADAAVAMARAHGADFIKVIGNVPPPAYFTLLRLARRSGLPVAGHLPVGVSPIAASDSGQKSIEHLHGATRMCTSRPDSVNALRGARAADTSDARRAALTRAITHVSATTFDERSCQTYFAALVRNGTWQVPTLSPPHEIGRLDQYDARADPYAAYATARLRADWRPENDPQLSAMTHEDFASLRELYGLLLRIVGAMSRAGVPLLVGTDVLGAHVYPGFAMHQELSYFVDAGLTPRAALEAATIAPARYLGATDSLGSVAEGKRADLVLLDADPVADIHNVSRISAVVMRGHVLDRRELDGMLQRAREFAAGCTGIIRCGDVSAAQEGSCAVAQRPAVTERLFRLFNSTDSLLVVAHSTHGIHAQPSTTPHGVLRDTNLCARVRAALRQNIIPEDAASGVPADSLLSFHDLGAYLVVRIHGARVAGVRMNDSGTPIYVFDREKVRFLGRFVL